MSVEMLTLADPADHLKLSPEAAPLRTRSPRRHRVDAFALKACIDSLQKELAKVEAIAAGHRADFERERERAERLVDELLHIELIVREERLGASRG
jgi:hypothetical protein